LEALKSEPLESKRFLINNLFVCNKTYPKFRQDPGGSAACGESQRRENKAVEWKTRLMALAAVVCLTMVAQDFRATITPDGKLPA